MTPAQLRERYPNLFLLDAADSAALADYLRVQGFLEPGENLRTATKAGEGNMNCTVRVATDRRSFIVKQSRPWVEKYPQFAAPWDRATREAEFYQLVRPFPAVADTLPCLLHHDAEARVLILEDLGTGSDFTDLYRGQPLDPTTLAELARFLGALHGAFATAPRRPGLANRDMRSLNHAHIFALPLQEENGLDLDAVQPGLRAAAAPLKADDALRDEVTRLGQEVYLADGPCLLHGDFFPGSFLRTTKGPRVIDPEFAFFGHPEFDAGVFLAHLMLAPQPAALRELWSRHYQPPPGWGESLARKLAGVEIIRRLIGYAQLPLRWTVAEKSRLLGFARDLVKDPDRDAFLEWTL